MNKYKVLALFGKSGSGKSAIQKWIVSNKKNVNEIIPCTTRPKRDNEIDGSDYHFINEKDFFKLKLENNLIDYSCFNADIGWYYGILFSSFELNKINVGSFNIHNIETFLKNPAFEVLPVYIQCFDKVRLTRSLMREKYVDCYEICRRFISDEEDFREVPFDYVTYDNSCSNDYINYGILELPKVRDFMRGKIN